MRNSGRIQAPEGSRIGFKKQAKDAPAFLLYHKFIIGEGAYGINGAFSHTSTGDVLGGQRVYQGFIQPLGEFLEASGE